MSGTTINPTFSPSPTCLAANNVWQVYTGCTINTFGVCWYSYKVLLSPPTVFPWDTIRPQPPTTHPPLVLQAIRQLAVQLVRLEMLPRPRIPAVQRNCLLVASHTVANP